MKFKDWLICIGASALVLLVVGIISMAFLGFYDGHAECLVVHCVKVIP
jgi:hypothetical protein